MFNFSSYLERFKNLRDPKQDRLSVINVLNRELNASLTEKDIEISRGVVRIVSSSLIKNMIFFKKDHVLSVLQQELPNLEIKGIS